MKMRYDIMCIINYLLLRCNEQKNQMRKFVQIHSIKLLKFDGAAAFVSEWII